MYLTKLEARIHNSQQQYKHSYQNRTQLGQFLSEYIVKFLIILLSLLHLLDSCLPGHRAIGLLKSSRQSWRSNGAPLLYASWAPNRWPKFRYLFGNSLCLLLQQLEVGSPTREAVESLLVVFSSPGQPVPVQLRIPHPTLSNLIMDRLGHSIILVH